MAPVPYTALGKLTLVYTVSGLTHKVDFPVDPLIVGGVGFVKSRITSTYSFPALSLADRIWSLAKAFYANTVLAPAWILYERSGISFVPIDSGAASGGAGTGGPVFLASQLSATFKDSANQRFNSYWNDTSWGPPAKGRVLGTNTTIDAYTSDFLPPAGSGSIGEGVVSRGDFGITRWTAWTISLNRRVRRERHLT